MSIDYKDVKVPEYADHADGPQAFKDLVDGVLPLTGGTLTGALAFTARNPGGTFQRWSTDSNRSLEMRREASFGEMGWYSVNVANGTKRLFKVNLDSHDGLFAFDTPVKIHGVAELEGGLIMSAPALPTGGNDLYNVVWSGRTGKFHRKPL